MHTFPITFLDSYVVPSDKETYPFTKHSAFKKPLEVSFLQHAVAYDGESYIDPLYDFEIARDRDRFQSHVRNKESVQTFEVNAIATKASSDLGKASDQHLKMWRDPDTIGHSLTFFSNYANPPCHLEFPIECFSEQLESRSRGVLRLTFRTQDGASVKSRKWSTTGTSLDKDIVEGPFVLLAISLAGGIT